MKQYLGIVRDANNVMVHAIHFSAEADSDAEIEMAYHVNPNRLFNGVLEERRVKAHPYPFSYCLTRKTQQQ